MARTLSRRRSAATRTESRVKDDGDYAADADEYADEDDTRAEPRRSRGSSNRRLARSASRPGRRERDEDERPARRRGKPEGRAAASVGRGWGAHKDNKARASSKGFNEEDRFTVEAGPPVLFHFLEDDPFASWLEHWVDEITEGKRSFVCPGDDCPLCDISYPTAERAAFNVVVFDKKGNPVVKYWIVTPEPMKHIEKRAENKRTSPLGRDDLYFEVSKEKKKNGFFEYTLEPVPPEDVEGDYGIEPLTDEELGDLLEEAFGADDVITLSTREELSEIADDLDD